MVLVGFKPDLDDQLVSFCGLVIWPVKVVPEMTYNVLSGMLSLYTTTHDLDLWPFIRASSQYVVLREKTITRFEERRLSQSAR